MSSGSMWAPANISQTISAPPPRTPRRNGTPNYKESDYASPNDDTSAAKDVSRSGASRGRWQRPKELLAEPSAGATSLLSRIDFGGTPPITSPQYKDRSARVARQPPPHLSVDVNQTKANQPSSLPHRLPALANQLPSVPASPVRVSKWVGHGEAGSAASRWAVKNPVVEQGNTQDTGLSSKVDNERNPDISTLEQYIEKLDMGGSREVILLPKTDSVDEAPNSAQTFNSDIVTTGTSEPSIAGPSTPPSRHSDLPDTSAMASAIPSTPSKYDWADEDDEDLDVGDLAAEWGIAVPGQTKAASTAVEVVKRPSAVSPPEATERTPNKTAPKSSRLPQSESDGTATKEFSSGRIPTTKALPIELLPDSPALSVPSSVPAKEDLLSPPSAEPAPTIRSPRKDRPRPEVRSDAFARLSKGLLKHQGKN